MADGSTENSTRKVTNRQVIAICGVPIIEIAATEGGGTVGESFDGIKALTFLGPFVVLVVAIVLWSIVSLTNVGKCPEKLQLEDFKISLNQCKLKEKEANSVLEISSKNITKLNDEKERYLVEKANLERDLGEARKEASDLKGELETVQNKAAKAELEAKEQLSKAVGEKEAMEQKFNSVELLLGACRNKEMKHQISNAQLLEELGEVKTQLEKC